MRHHDTGWRDGLLIRRHATWGVPAPAAGMTLPMIEYDKGEAVAAVNYVRRGTPLPAGRDVARAFSALGSLYRATGERLPFFTAVYDPANWSFALLAHNEPALMFLDSMRWVRMTEREFVTNLYRLRGRFLPDLSAHGVTWATEAWQGGTPDQDRHTPPPAETWPNEDMSRRRRDYEPVGQVRMGLRNPCTDIDLLVVDRDDHPALIVDYKAPGARPDPVSWNARALASMRRPYRRELHEVPAMLVSYDPRPVDWAMHVHCLNTSARELLTYALGGTDNITALAETIAGTGWTDLREGEWSAVIKAARDS